MPRLPAPAAQDYVEIQNLYAYYNLVSDAGDAEAYAGCFTDDGVLNINHLKFTVKGRADLIGFKEKDKAGRGERYRRHWNGSIVLETIDDHPNGMKGVIILSSLLSLRDPGDWGL